MDKQLEERKSQELIALLKRLGRIESKGLSRLYREHIVELPAWKEFFESEATRQERPISNQRIGFSIGLRLTRLVSEGKIRNITKPDPMGGQPLTIGYEPLPA